MLKQVFDLFGDVEPFLRENEEICPANREHLLEIFDDPQSCQDLRLELAAIIDDGVHFVNATYYLEADGPLMFSCYRCTGCSSQSLPYYRGGCSRNCERQRCHLQSVNGTSKGLYSARTELLPVQIQRTVSRHSKSF